MIGDTGTILDIRLDTESSPAEQIHVTGTQRSGHNMIALALTTLANVVWYKQWEKGPWVLKNIIYYDDREGKEWQKYEMEDFSEWISEAVAPPEALSLDGGNTFVRVKAIRVTEFKSQSSFHIVHEREEHSTQKFNVIRDPRNVLASAVAKGWSKEHCSSLMDANEFQYTSEILTKEYVNLSYDKWLSSFAEYFNKGGEIDIGGFKITESIGDALRATMVKTANSSFGIDHTLDEFFTRYQRPEVTSNPIFQELWPRSLRIFDEYYQPFLCKL
jgi:hypothetical protein